MALESVLGVEETVNAEMAPGAHGLHVVGDRAEREALAEVGHGQDDAAVGIQGLLTVALEAAPGWSCCAV